MRKVQLATGSYYHIYNRGVDRRTVFEDSEDYQRFYRSLYLFNDATYRNPGNEPFYNEALLAGHDVLKETQEHFVHVVSYCLMPNHFHLLLYQRQDNGIEKYLHKLGVGYTGYFNRRHGRSGSLFESTYKAVQVEGEGQLLHLPRYIHCNALDLANFAWRDGMVGDWSQAQKFLDNFPWSSHDVYMGKGQELPLVHLEEVQNIFPNAASYIQFLEEWAARSLPCDLVTSE